jgi:hypothetical protein
MSELFRHKTVMSLTGYFSFGIQFLICLSFYTSDLSAQQSSLSKGVNYLSSYIASEEFKELSETKNHIELTDSIYLRAVNFYNGDYSEALLALMLAAVPYKIVPIQIPVLNIVINYPLTAAEDSIFLLKNSNLPKYLFFDSPQTDYGDKDKLAHFFGSAFLAYSPNFFDLGNLIGYFIEVFEESFKVQSSVDNRDLYVNSLGIFFGKVLKKNKDLLPSDILILNTLIHIRYSL